jgi:pimeloyl-ACP methyl ester carboxylesterase
MLLLHGFASTFAHTWGQTGWVDILGDFDCVVPEVDLPGHGSSTSPMEPGMWATVGEEAMATLPEPRGAVGFSAGAKILLRIATAHPHSFGGIVLLGLGDNVFDPSDPQPIIDALEGDAEPEDVQARLFYRLAESTGNDPEALATFLRETREPMRPEQLGAIACPVLVVLGDRDHVRSATRLVATLPSATFLSLPGVDHFATPSNFGAIEATMDFLGFG